MSKTTIILEKSTRENLLRIGRKNQTYDNLINELIKLKENQENVIGKPNFPTTTDQIVTTKHGVALS